MSMSILRLRINICNTALEFSNAIKSGFDFDKELERDLHLQTQTQKATKRSDCGVMDRQWKSSSKSAK